MNWQKIKFWTKWSLIGLVLLYVLLLLYWNRTETTFSYFFTEASVFKGSLWLVMLVSFLFGSLVTLILGWMIRGYFALRRKRDEKTARTLDDEIADMNRKAAMLRTRESVPPVESSKTDASV
ncbi:MAG: LapA family protein [Tepidisphaeraceae bacterium]